VSLKSGAFAPIGRVLCSVIGAAMQKLKLKSSVVSNREKNAGVLIIGDLRKVRKIYANVYERIFHAILLY
jgi:hypothetical protein